MAYAEQRFRHRQDGTCHVGAHPKWGSKTLGITKSTMKKFGCVVDSTGYILSRFYVKDITPGTWLEWLNDHNGFAGDLLRWQKVDEYTKNKLRYTTNAADKSYTMRNVWVMGADRAMYSHWVVELSGGNMFDPLDGNIKSINSYPPVLDSKRQINRRYFKRT